MAQTPAQFAQEKLGALERRAQRRVLQPTDREGGIHVRRSGRELVSFCCNDYLNLSADARVKAAAKAAIDRFGAGAGASRLVTGDHPLFAELEAALAAFKGTEDAVVFGSGYLANLGIIPTFARSGDLILVDELAHACLNAGAQLSGATVIRFAHNDMAALESELAARREDFDHCLIMTDGVFSMDGDLAPLPRLAGLAEDHDAWLMTDDAHGIGVVGGGRGSSFAFEPTPKVPLQMGTLSKALGSYGGYLCAGKAVCDLIRTRARPLVYSTGLPPASAAAALKALEIVAGNPALCDAPVQKARAFAEAVGLPVPESPIVPLILGDERAALKASSALEEAGFLVTAIRPPTVPPGTARLRFTFSAGHDDADVARLADLVRTLTVAAAAE
jgi:8-amino-7-oxononanoate synthase